MSDNSLENVKPGDILVWSYGYGLDTRNLVRCLRVTPAQIFIPSGGRERRYWKKSGTPVGRGPRYSSDQLRVPAPDEIREITARNARASLIRRLKSTDFNALSEASLHAIAAILDAEERKSE